MKIQLFQIHGRWAQNQFSGLSTVVVVVENIKNASEQNERFKDGGAEAQERNHRGWYLSEHRHQEQRAFLLDTERLPRDRGFPANRADREQYRGGFRKR